MCWIPPDPARALCSLRIAAAVTGRLAGDLWLTVWFLTGSKWSGPLCLNKEVLPAVTSETIRLHYVVSDQPDMVTRAQSFSLCRLPSLPPSWHNGWSICAQCSAGLPLPFKGAKYRAEVARARPALINHTPAANNNICRNSSHCLLITCRC